MKPTFMEWEACQRRWMNSQNGIPYTRSAAQPLGYTPQCLNGNRPALTGSKKTQGRPRSGTKADCGVESRARMSTPPSNRADFVIAQPARTSCDYYGRVLDSIGKLRL